MSEFNCVCISDQGYPNEIPLEKRPKKGEKYTIIKVDKLLTYGGMLGVKLAEINIDDCEPYSYFAASRFAPLILEDSPKEEELEEMTI